MIRTQVYLPKSLYEQVQLLARKNHKAAAAVIRELLIADIPIKAGNPASALVELSKLGLKGPTNLSTTLDEELYG
jgi:hypothetical protein